MTEAQRIIKLLEGAMAPIALGLLGGVAGIGAALGLGLDSNHPLSAGKLAKHVGIATGFVAGEFLSRRNKRKKQ